MSRRVLRVRDGMASGAGDALSVFGLRSNFSQRDGLGIEGG